MHVLNICNSINTSTGGGTADRTLQMSLSFVKAGHKCSVITTDLSLPLNHLNKQKLKFVNLIILPLFWRRFIIPKIKWFQISSIVKEVDIVHLIGHWNILNILIFFIARFYKKPYVICPAGALILFGRSILIKKIYNKFIGSYIVRNASAVIATSKNEYKYFLHYGVNKSKIVFLPNGVCFEDFNLNSEWLYKNKNIFFSKKNILFVGRLNLIKGPDLLLNAFTLIHKKIPDYHLIFCGPDEGMIKALENRAHEENLSHKVHFVGYLDGEDKTYAYRSSDLLVIPSRHEAMSIVVLEAGACGIPAIVTRNGGFSEIGRVNKKLVASNDPRGIAESILYILSDCKRKNEIAIRYSNFVREKYTWERLILRYINLYEKIIKSQH
jgi:glycosyltransferase involved in cell wall biosynthesis